MMMMMMSKPHTYMGGCPGINIVELRGLLCFLAATPTDLRYHTVLLLGLSSVSCRESSPIPFVDLVLG